MRLLASEDTIILELLAKLGPDSSKNTLRSWLEKGRVMVDGKMIKDQRVIVKQGQEVSVGPRTEFMRGDIEILFEDKDIVVIQKPEGLLSVATDYDKEGSAHSYLKRRYATRRVYPVHRLDRETSGIMVFAYTEKAKEVLKERFFEHTIQREYGAVVEGRMENPTGTWTSFLEEDDFYVVKSTRNAEKGKKAITHYGTEATGKRCTLLKLTLETGRKNQIRVHCLEAGHPIVGDKKYGSSRNPVKRLCLHACKLGFLHPITGKPLLFTSPLPASFHKLVR